MREGRRQRESGEGVWKTLMLKYLPFLFTEFSAKRTGLCTPANYTLNNCHKTILLSQRRNVTELQLTMWKDKYALNSLFSMPVLTPRCLWQRFSTALGLEKHIHAFSRVKRSPRFASALHAPRQARLKYFFPISPPCSLRMFLDLFRALRTANCSGLGVSLSKANTFCVVQVAYFYFPTVPISTSD